MEILISVALSAFLLVIIYSTYFGINRSIEAASDGQEVMVTGRMMIELIKRDMGGIVSSQNYSFKGIAKENGGGETTTFIEFTTMSSINEIGPRLNKVGYTLTETEKGQLTMIRFSVRNPNADLFKEGVAFEVSNLITAFNVEFYDGSDWATSWDSSKTGRLPQQIKLTIEVKDAKGNTKTVISEEGIRGSM